MLRSPQLDSASYMTEKAAESPRIGTGLSHSRFTPERQEEPEKNGRRKFLRSLWCC